MDIIHPIHNVDVLEPYLSIHPYEKIKENKKVFKLDWNEPTVSLNSKAIFALIKFIRKGNINWYPDPRSSELKSQISKYAGISREETLLTNGSDEAHRLICDTYLREQSKVILLLPTYSNFIVKVKNKGCEIIEFEQEKDKNLDVDKFTTAARGTKLAYLVNPYISTLSRETIIKILSELQDTIVVIDEAYFEFYGKTLIDLIRKYKNLIITRSFSKVFGLAGLRLGYICSNQKNIAILSRLYSSLSVNILAQIAGVEVLKEVKYIKQYVSEVKESMKLVSEWLDRLNFEIIKTRAGFILFKHKLFSKKTVLKKLEENNIFVRDLTETRAVEGYLRMNVGDKKTTESLLKKFRAIFKEKVPFKSF